MATASEKQLTKLFAAISRQRDELDELVANPPKPLDFLEGSFQAQRAFIEDPSRLKVVLCTRRAGKSFGDGLYLFKTAYENPRCSVVYFGLTRQSAKNIMWKPVFEVIDDRYKIGAKFNLSELTITLPNESVIYVLGADSGEKEMRKAFGQKFNLVIIDEGALYTIDLNRFVYSVLQPATADNQGTICITGMPSNLKRGLFFNLTREKTAEEDREQNYRFARESATRWRVQDFKNGAEWSGHFWTAFDNPHMREQWTNEIEEKKRNNPRIEETPFFQQEYLGQWAVDDDKLVYKYRPGRNDFDGTLPEYERGSWHFVLGVDLGYEDDTAFTVAAYHDFDKNVYFLESWGEAKLDITAVAGHVHELDERYTFDEYIIDGSNKQAVEELRRRHQIPFKAADKSGKADFIELMNGDFITGRIKVDPGRCMSLTNEYAELIWDDRSAKRQEHPGCSNHRCFVAGTMVRTADGERPIETLVPGDLVWTRQGLRPAVVAWATGAYPILRLEVEGGRVLYGTADHPVWTQDGWKELQALTQDDTVCVWANTDRAKPSSTTASRTGATPSLRAGRSESTTRRSAVSAFIAFFGWSITASRNCLARLTSIISTRTRSTTQSRTSSPSTATHISASTPASPSASPSLARQSRSPSSTPPRGTPPRRGADGTLRTLELAPRSGSSSTAPASSAERPSRARCEQPRCADRTATRSDEGSPARTTSTSPAPAAERSSDETSTRSPDVAPCRVLRITDTGSVQMVYALSVRDVHEYFANDVLVSNCDSALYTWRRLYAYLADNPQAKVLRGSPEWYVLEADRMEEGARELVLKEQAEREEEDLWGY